MGMCFAWSSSFASLRLIHTEKVPEDMRRSLVEEKLPYLAGTSRLGRPGSLAYTYMSNRPVSSLLFQWQLDCACLPVWSPADYNFLQV